MKRNICGREQTEPFINKPIENSDKYKTPKDRPITEKTSTLPQDLKIIDPTRTPKSDDTKVVDTKGGTNIPSSDSAQDRHINQLPNDKSNDESTIIESDPPVRDTIPTNKADEPVLLTTGRPRRNVRKPDRYGHNICE